MIDYTQIDHGPLKRSRTLTREEFVQECALVSRSTPEQVLEFHEIAVCRCGASDCPGWTATYLLQNKRRKT